MGCKTRQVIHGRIISVTPGQRKNTALSAKCSDQIDRAAAQISSAAVFLRFPQRLEGGCDYVIDQLCVLKEDKVFCTSYKHWKRDG